MTITVRRGNRAITLLSAGHAGVDFYQGAVPALVPVLVAERHYDYVAASGIVLAATLLSSIVQPLFGLLTDRRAMPWLLPASMATAGIGLAMSGLGGSYWSTWLGVALSGLGVAAYHPEAARLARVVSGGAHTGMSWFSLGGNIGFALAPVVVTPVLAAGGLGATPFLVAPAAVATLLTASVLRTFSRHDAETRAEPDRRGHDDWPRFLRLTAVVMCRSIVYMGLSAFVALYVRGRVPGGATAGAVALFVLFAGGAVGTVLGGRLAAKHGRVRTMRIAYAATIPALAGVVFAPGYAVYLFVAAAAITLYVPFSLHITLGQDYLPNRVGTASGVTLGLAVSVGGIASPAIGALADGTSLQIALAALIGLAVVSWLLALTLPEPASQDRQGTIEST
ncbi:MFS transporter [Amycolatopsis sp. CA-230715]|uniref:MFS transporter n=1 Tax=Amycolatopsis sp. CA-230715 TaxID=2745196 RepID=UPI001C333D45|nr:MFS transporter [Amycolatopsis sp. CA-230715]QWF78455.1 Fosmidomycin resistance protein [Amycolatopsis sp. CA-230715]